MTVKQYPYKLIDGTLDENKALCEWFGNESKLHHDTFEVGVLDDVQE